MEVAGRDHLAARVRWVAAGRRAAPALPRRRARTRRVQEANVRLLWQRLRAAAAKAGYTQVDDATAQGQDCARFAAARAAQTQARASPDPFGVFGGRGRAQRPRL